MPLQRKKLKQTYKTTTLFLCFLFSNFLMPFSSSFGAEETSEEMKINFEKPNNDTLSMSFDSALLKDVLLLFSQQSGLNFIASQEVENKKVTVYFENVSPQDALDSIITANGLTYTKKPGSDIYMVFSANKAASTARLVTKVVHLKYMRLSSSPLDVGGGVTISDLTKTSAPSSSSSSSSSSTSSASSSSTTATPSEKGADKLVAKLLTPQGKVAEDTQTNSLIITDTSENIDAIMKILEEVDVPPSQVILEVHVMEVSKTISSNIGVDWGGTSGALGSFTSGIRTTAFPFTEEFIKGQQGGKATIVTGNISSTGGITSTTSATPSQLQYGTINASNFTATLHYIESDSRTKILARPRVLTQNNEAAAIKVVTNQAIGTTSTVPSSAVASTTTTADRAEVGVTMRMTPQINNDDSVLLFLEPAVTTASDSTLFPGVFRDTTTRLVRTMARIKDNQTLVIGGLINGNDASTKKKLPLLGDLPAIGHIFSYYSGSNTDSELLIFVTPHIVRGLTSLGPRSATARGEDIPLRKILSVFKDKEMEESAESFHNFEKTRQPFFAQDQQFIRDTEKHASNPLVEKQMTQALDAMNTQFLDIQMNQTLDRLDSKKYRI